MEETATNHSGLVRVAAIRGREGQGKDSGGVRAVHHNGDEVSSSSAFSRATD